MSCGPTRIAWTRDVNKRDARLLVSWWNAHDLKHLYSYEKLDHSKLYTVWRFELPPVKEDK